MHSKVLMMAAAGVGWLAASLVAFVIVALVDFLGIGLIGVFIAFASSQVELESGNNAGGAYGASMIAKQTELERQMSPEQRAATATTVHWSQTPHASSDISDLVWH